MMIRWMFKTSLLLLTFVSLCTPGAGLNQRLDERYKLEKEPSYWHTTAQKELRKTMSERFPQGVAKNVIMFLGDGMGPSTVTAARVLGGQKEGKRGEENMLSFDKFPFTGQSRTYSVDTQITDSAASGTAYLTGVKTNQGMLGLSAHALRHNCSTAQGHEVTSILQWFLDAGKSAGIVTTTRVTHASPAASYSHSVERNWESDGEVPEADRARCKDIAAQLIEDNPDIRVIMGGGRTNFFPNGTADPDPTSQSAGRRISGNLIETWKTNKTRRNISHQFVYDKAGLDQVDPLKTDSVLGLFATSHMAYDALRDPHKEPSLAEMTQKAIEILQQKGHDQTEEGFFLFVEGGRIDHAHHDNVASLALHDTLAFSQAVERATQLTSVDDTLIVVTADHSHTMVMAGYAERGNPILAKSVGPETMHTQDNLPYTTILYGSGPGALNHTGQRQNLTFVDTEAFDYKQQAIIPVPYSTHAGEDVAIYARGPQSFLFTGVHEQNYIPMTMAYAACVGEYAEANRNCAKFHPQYIGIQPMIGTRTNNPQMMGHSSNSSAHSSVHPGALTLTFVLLMTSLWMGLNIDLGV